MFNYTIHHALHLPRHWLMIFVTLQCPKMCVSSGGWRARPRLLQILMAEFRQKPFFFSSHPKATAQVEGQRGLACLPGRSPPTRHSHWCSLDCEDSRSAEADKPESRGAQADCIITIRQEASVDV